MGRRTERSPRPVAVLAAVLLLVCASAPVIAHHSFALFNLSKVVTVRGTIRAFEWAEPHAWIDLAVIGPDGQPSVVAFQCFGPEVLRRKGWRKRRLKVGQPLTVRYFPNRSGRPGGAVRSVTLADGSVLGSYDFPIQPAISP